MISSTPDEDIDFMPPLQALRMREGSIAWQWTGFALIVLVLAGITWACWGQSDIVVRANGRVVPIGQVKSLASTETARIQSIRVSEGQAVEAGEVLVELDDRRVRSERDKSLQALQAAIALRSRSSMLGRFLTADSLPSCASDALQAHLARLSVEGLDLQHAAMARAQARSQLLDLCNRMQGLMTEIERHERLLPITSQRLLDYQRLLQEGFVSSHALLEREQAHHEVTFSRLQAFEKLQGLLAQIRRELQDSLADADRQIQLSSQDIRRADAQLDALCIRAPVRGHVHQLAVHTEGGVVSAAQPMMQIVPHAAAIEVEAFVDNRDRGFIEVGQLASVRVDAYDYTRYGTLPARVTYIAHDATSDARQEPVFKVRLALQSESFSIAQRQHWMVPGLRVVADLRTGSRSVISYLLSPLVQHWHEAGRER